ISGVAFVSDKAEADLQVILFQLELADLLLFEEFDEIFERLQLSSVHLRLAPWGTRRPISFYVFFSIEVECRCRIRETPNDQYRPRVSESSYSSIQALVDGVKISAPCLVTSTMSSMRMPKRPGRYTPGSMVITMPVCNFCCCRAAIRGPSWISSPTPCPVEWVK